MRWADSDREALGKEGQFQKSLIPTQTAPAYVSPIPVTQSLRSLIPDLRYLGFLEGHREGGKAVVISFIQECSEEGCRCPLEGLP